MRHLPEGLYFDCAWLLPHQPGTVADKINVLVYIHTANPSMFWTHFYDLVAKAGGLLLSIFVLVNIPFLADKGIVVVIASLILTIAAYLKICRCLTISSRVGTGKVLLFSVTKRRRNRNLLL